MIELKIRRSLSDGPALSSMLALSLYLVCIIRTRSTSVTNAKGGCVCSETGELEKRRNSLTGGALQSFGSTAPEPAWPHMLERFPPLKVTSLTSCSSSSTLYSDIKIIPSSSTHTRRLQDAQESDSFTCDELSTPPRGPSSHAGMSRTRFHWEGSDLD